jgi:uncharacterized protein (UPF0333 family)
MKAISSDLSIVILNLILMIIGVGILFLSSIFYMGSKEDYEELINNSYLKFFVNRLIFNLLIGLVLVCLILFINFCIQKIGKVRIEIKNIAKINILVYLISSLGFIAYQLSR